MASEHIIQRSKKVACRELPLPAGLTVWHCGEAVSLSGEFFAPCPDLATLHRTEFCLKVERLRPRIFLNLFLKSGPQGEFIKEQSVEQFVFWQEGTLEATRGWSAVSGTGLPGAVPAGHSTAWFVRDTETRELRHGPPSGPGLGIEWRGGHSVSVWLHQGRLRTDVLRCVCASTTLEGRHVYQWLQASRRTAHSDLGAAARPSMRLTRLAIKLQIMEQAQHFEFPSQDYQFKIKWNQSISKCFCKKLFKEMLSMIRLTLVFGCLKIRRHLSLYFSNQSVLISQLYGTNLTACRLNHLLSAPHQNIEYRDFIWWRKCRSLQHTAHAGW